MQQIDARENISRRSEDVTRANIERVQSSLETQATRLANAQRLFDKGATSRAAFLDVQQTYTDLNRQREVYDRELKQKSAERMGLNSERQKLLADKRSELFARHAEIQARLAALRNDEQAKSDQVSAATLRAPMSGIVDQSKVFTIGGVTEAGQELMRIVPVDADIEIEAVFSNQDIGFMAIGQNANIRMKAYPSERFGFIKGYVNDISADSLEVAKSQLGYIVHVTPKKSALSISKTKYPLRPGMTASVDVVVGKRRIISYFFAPILRTIEDAMGEK